MIPRKYVRSDGTCSGFGERTVHRPTLHSIYQQVRTPEDAEVIRRQRFGLFIALALAREQHQLWERMQV